ncbi:fibroblast growth factor-binding protein 1 [Podarcis raffonei]|uniref:fibroblast growth factor-binding protein 1 n=1 Tax=Podarcis raffonei TaxID=65483 RepID=UPI0023297920|nr:fibroblast growth factor-binding protein 1 [Podarcis raffonei]XP_053259155.1 fibroblast growth factor-binding protein 1 [Podarcis raffonei]
MKIRHFAVLCALIVFSQVLQADCEIQKERRRGRTNNGKGERPQPGSDDQNGRGQKTRGQKGSLKGKFVTKEKSECTWALNEAEIATLKIDCKRSESTFSCEFSGNPSSCPQYAENKKVFWKQITRSLKRQKNICEDPKSILKSKICRKGPSTAHLRMVTPTSSREDKPVHHGQETALEPGTSGTQPDEASSNCVEDVDYIDQKKVAEEHCSELWRSLCLFVISMIQDKKCK